MEKIFRKLLNMRKILILPIIICLYLQAMSQNDFEKYVKEQEAAFSKYNKTVTAEFKAYNDSINRQYAKYLEETWKNFDLQSQEKDFKPMPKPPVYVPDAPKPEPEKVPIIQTPEPPKPKPEEEKPQPPVPKPEPVAPQQTIKTVFFGTSITVNKIEANISRLSDISEKEVAAYWSALAKLKIEDLINELLRVKADLHLNDWGMYLLAGKFFETYFTGGNENEKVVFTVFALNQLGYRAKIGRSQNELVALLAIENNVFNTLYFAYGNENGSKYAVVNPKRKDLVSIQTCRMDYAGATKNFEMSLRTLPHFSVSTQTKTLNDHKNNYSIAYNKNMVNFYATYPCVDFSIYAEAPLDEAFLKSIESQIKPKITGKSQEDAINFLLHFVQYAFEYKTDQEQFGYEKWNFSEETLHYPFADCEDRSILFAQLVRRLLKMPVVLLHYPGYHLATAVKFNNPNTIGDYIMVDGQKYLLCDPTYVGANLGMGMPQLRKIAVEVVKLK
jgi:hypothetical protein